MKKTKRLTKQAKEILALHAELERMRIKNRELNRRANGVDSVWQKRAMKAEHEVDMWRNSWGNDFGRMCSAHNELKEVFLECMRVKKIKFWAFHSVMDSNFLGKSKTYTENPGSTMEKTHNKVYANCYGSPKGDDNSSHVVTEVVKEVVDELVRLKKSKKNKFLARYIDNLKEGIRKGYYSGHTDVKA